MSSQRHTEDPLTSAEREELDALRTEVAALRRLAGGAMAPRKAVGDALRLAGTIPGSAEMTTVHAPDGTYLWVSPSARDLIGYEPEELIGRDPYDLIHPEDIPAVEVGHRSLIENPQKPVSFLYRMAREDGHLVWIETHAQTVQGEDGALPLQLVAFSRDVSGVLETERRLGLIEERNRVYMEATNSIAWEADPVTCQFTYIGARADEPFGYKLRKWLAPNFWVEHMHPEDREKSLSFCKMKTANGADHEIEYRMLSADGSIHWIRDFVTVVMKDGAPSLMRGILIDITEEKEAEAKSRLRDRALARLLDTFDGVLYRRREDDDWTLEYVTDGCMKLTGFRPIDMLYSTSMRFVDVLHPKDRKRVMEEFSHAREDDLEHLEIRYRLKMPGNKSRWVLDLADFVVDPATEKRCVEGLLLGQKSDESTVFRRQE